MMAFLPAAARFALAVGLGCAHILKPLLDFIEGISPLSPLLEAAVAFVLVTLPVAYLVGVVLVYLHVTPPAAAAPLPGVRQLAVRACTVASALLVALVTLLVAFMFLAGSRSPPGEGTPRPT